MKKTKRTVRHAFPTESPQASLQDGQQDTRLAVSPELSTLVVTLLKSVLYRDDKPALWDTLLRLQANVADYVAVLGLDLTVDEAEGYAYLRSRGREDEEESAGNRDEEAIPRLVTRRQLSYPVSLVLALLRKKLAEFDAGGCETRLVLSREEIVDMVRIFLPERTNEVKLAGQIAGWLDKIEDLGFVRRLKGQEDMYEVRRILKAFVDAQWLGDFDERLAKYQEIAQAKGGANNG